MQSTGSLSGISRYLSKTTNSLGVRRYSTKNPYQGLLRDVKLGSNSYKYYELSPLGHEKLRMYPFDERKKHCLMFRRPSPLLHPGIVGIRSKKL